MEHENQTIVYWLDDKRVLEDTFVVELAKEVLKALHITAMDDDAHDMLDSLLNEFMAGKTQEQTSISLLKTNHQYAITWLKNDNPEHLELMAVYELETGDFLYIQDSSEEEDFDYTIADNNLKIKDGGLWGYGHGAYLSHETMQEFLEDLGFAGTYYKLRKDLDIDNFID